MAHSQAEVVALDNSFPAVVTALISAVKASNSAGVGVGGSFLIDVERLDTDDLSALVWLGKSCFAEVTAASALLCTFDTSACKVERTPLLSWTLLSSSTDFLSSLTFEQ